MQNKMIGNVVQFLESENIGIVREQGTKKEFIFFIDELSRHEVKSVQHGAKVTFEKNDAFVHQIATNLITIYQIKKAA